MLALYSVFVMPNFIGLHGVWLSFALPAAIYAVFLLFIFKPFKQKFRKIIACGVISVTAALALIFIAPSVYRASVPRLTEEINLRDYMPFGEYLYDGQTHKESAAAKLTTEPTLRLTGELPRLDGATALYPLYAAFVEATYPAPRPGDERSVYFPYNDLRSGEYNALAVCSTTPVAYENLIDGYADIAFLVGVSDEQRKMAEDNGLELTLTPIGREAFVFFVNSRSSAENLSVEDIKRIYSGEVKNWSEVGGDSGEIKAYQRPDESGSQTMLKQIMGDVPIVPAPVEEILDTMAGMYERVAEYKNYRNSLGYSFLYYIRDMIGENKVKFLSVNNVAPTPENIASGAYPFAHEFYAVTVKSGGGYLNPERTENIDKLLEWLVSPQAQGLVGATGYLPMD
jgi:phosphate transport system substrate-binding protein